MAYDEDLADRIRELIGGESGVTEQKMFGGLAFLVGGHMAVSASRRAASSSTSTRPPPALLSRTRPRRW
jgi:hypothetical protein